MKNILLTFFLISICISTANAQVQSNGTTTPAITTQNPFFDASSNFDTSVSPNNEGKGLVFPRTDLTAWTFKTAILDGVTFPTAYDGMIVYNTGTGSTLAGQGIVVAVTPGFYFFSNPTGTIDVSTGQWKPLGSGTAPIATPAKMVLSPEYAGGILSANLTADADVPPSANANILTITTVTTEAPLFFNAYQVSNFETNGSTNNYDILVKITVPSDFDSWDATSPITLQYAGTTDASMNVTVTKVGDFTPLSTTLVTGSGLAQSTISIASIAQLATLSAGNTFCVKINVTVTDVATVNASVIRLGDLTLNYYKF